MSIAEQAKHVTSFQQQAGQLMEGLSDMQTLLEEKEFQVCGLWLNSSPESHPCVPVVLRSCVMDALPPHDPFSEETCISEI